MGIEVAAENGVANFSAVNAQLVRATGDRCEQDTGAIAKALDNVKVGQGWLAVFMADLLARATLPIAGDREIDGASLFNITPQDSSVGFIDFFSLKLPRQIGVDIAAQWHHHQARGIQIEPVGNRGRGVVLLDSSNHAVFVLLQPTRYR